MSATFIDLLTADIESEIPILHNISVDICVRGVHYYNIQPDIGIVLNFSAEDDPLSLIHDRYAIAVKTADGDGRKIGHVPKFMSRFVYYFLRHGGTVTGRVIGSREYSFDLEQGGLQIPATYYFMGPPRIVDVFKTNILRLIEENTVEEENTVA